MDKPTEPGWYLFRFTPLGEADDHAGYWDGAKLSHSPAGTHSLSAEELAGCSNFRPLIPKPAPEVIIGDGKTVLRPGVWVSKNGGSVRWWNSHLVESDCAPFVSWHDKEYTRIGDVPE